jgi:hypothetical protein
MASTMFLADMSEISCSADLPPKRIATRIFFFIGARRKVDRRLKIED